MRCKVVLRHSMALGSSPINCTQRREIVAFSRYRYQRLLMAARLLFWLAVLNTIIPFDRTLT
jgi:hypothetical protein